MRRPEEPPLPSVHLRDAVREAARHVVHLLDGNELHLLQITDEGFAVQNRRGLGACSPAWVRGGVAGSWVRGGVAGSQGVRGCGLACQSGSKTGTDRFGRDRIVFRCNY